MGGKGFTDEVFEVLGLEKPYWDFGDVKRFRVSSSILLKIAERVPEWNLDDRQNNSPMFRDFLEVARRDERCVFEIYVVPKERKDERVTVEGVYVPADRKDLVDFLLKKAVGKPDEFMETEDGKYVYMWWD